MNENRPIIILGQIKQDPYGTRIGDKHTRTVLDVAGCKITVKTHQKTQLNITGSAGHSYTCILNIGNVITTCMQSKHSSVPKSSYATKTV